MTQVIACQAGFDYLNTTVSHRAHRELEEQSKSLSSVTSVISVAKDFDKMVFDKRRASHERAGCYDNRSERKAPVDL